MNCICIVHFLSRVFFSSIFLKSLCLHYNAKMMFLECDVIHNWFEYWLMYITWLRMETEQRNDVLYSPAANFFSCRWMDDVRVIGFVFNEYKSTKWNKHICRIQCDDHWKNNIYDFGSIFIGIYYKIIDIKRILWHWKIVWFNRIAVKLLRIYTVATSIRRIEPIPSKIANVKMSSCERDTVSMNCQQKYNAFNSINVFKTPNLFVGKKLNKVGVVFLVKLRRKIRLITCLWLLKPHLAIWRSIYFWRNVQWHVWIS